MHVVKAVVFGQINQHSRGTAAFSCTTEAAVTDPSAWGAHPVLYGEQANGSEQHFFVVSFLALLSSLTLLH